MIVQLREALNDCIVAELKHLLSFCDVAITKELKRKQDYVNLCLTLLQKRDFVENMLEKMNKSEQSAKLYSYLIWFHNYLKTSSANSLYGLNLTQIKVKPYRPFEGELTDNLALIKRVIEADWRGQTDDIYIAYNLQKVLKLFYPKPKDYEILEIEAPKETKYIYNNEEGVLDFINTIEEMLQNNLVEFGKTNEKPLLKSLNILKTTTSSNEFYTEKKLNNLTTDMLTRSFSYYYWQNRKFENKEQKTLRRYVKRQLDDRMDFFITRIFGNYLKKIRYDSYYTSQKELFDLIATILSHISQRKCVSVENILHFCIYRELYFYLETVEKTDEYYLQTENGDARVEEDYYYELFFEPFLKASLFYLGALGVLELRYDDPVSPHGGIKSKGENYISPWDGLKYVSITKLGLYVMGKSDKYEAVVTKKETKNIKFDTYKPIVFVDSADIITITKLEPFCEKLDANRYILSYGKIFKDCKSSKALDLKIDNFSKIFHQKLPKVFDDFFAEIKENANLLKRDLKLITIELSNNKKLLNLFMTNKKIQELIIKASGYRVLVKKENIPKLTKIVKEHGFFVDF